MNTPTSFESLPSMVAELNRKIDQLITSLGPAREEEDYLMRMEDLLIYLPEKPARQTVYGWINERRIPYEKHGRRLYFRKSDIDKWIAEGRPTKES